MIFCSRIHSWLHFSSPHHLTKGIERHLLPGGGRRGQYLKVHIHLSLKSAGSSWKPSPITIVNGTEMLIAMPETSAVTTPCKHFDRNFDSAPFFSPTYSIFLQCKRRIFSLLSQFQKGGSKANRGGTGCVTDFQDEHISVVTSLLLTMI